ncbi:hypothetical protein K437DRAFT_70482 [Tilletiaria anomala UBC 951]|uniref:Uncharacterized protein n=1 Tax=Tilletiaria anomala (strain ATCC 24038 / CBS 436.72 / UBC 951) TaxID=1037660 RepID=A0A066WHY6_TILAU|nr:uncharacterized protein K437DRAFT_70482 [Tilletiaria anomala UBC 951]KDN53406.1 hypothetical protein K437DRAFT_70482 [Tilletiaria anomala UBC 951]
MATNSPPGYSAVAGAASGSPRAAAEQEQQPSRPQGQSQREQQPHPDVYTMAAQRSSSFLQQQQRQARNSLAAGTKRSGGGRADATESFLSQLILFLDALPPITQWPRAIYQTCIYDPLLAVVSLVLDVVRSPRTHRIALRLGVLITLLWTALAFAIIAYIGFVRVWLPQVGLRKTVWLQYGESRPPYAYLNFEPAQSRHSFHSEAAEDILNSKAHFFADDQEYDVTLELQVPLTAANIDLGNFMAALDLRNEKNETVWKASRPAILLQEPLPVRALSSLSLLFSRSLPTGSLASSLVGGTSGGFDNDDDDASPASLLPAFLSAGPASLSWSIPTQMISIPLLRRKVMHASKPMLAFLEPEHEKRSRNQQQHETGVSWAKPGSAQVKSGIVSVGRADADRFWYAASGVAGAGAGTALGLHGGRSGEMWAGLNGAKSRGELQTHSVTLRFDVHLTGIRSVYIMYHHPILSFLLFTSLFFSFELLAGLFLWAVATIYTSPSLHSGLRPSLHVEESWVEGIRRRRPAPATGRRAAEGRATEETYTEEDGGEEADEDGELTETEDRAARRWEGLMGTDNENGGDSDAEPHAAWANAPAGYRATTEDETGPGTSLRRRAASSTSIVTAQTEQQRTGRTTSADPRAAMAAAAATAASAFRSRDEEERAEAERTRMRRDTLAGRRMTEITALDLDSLAPSSSGPSSPIAVRGGNSSGAGTSPGEGGDDASPAAVSAPSGDPFLDVMSTAPSRRRILSRLDEETEEDTVSASSTGDAASTLDDDEEEMEARPTGASIAKHSVDVDDDDKATSTAGRTMTLGGSETSRGSSMARSFAATTAPSVSTETSYTPSQTQRAPGSAELTPTAERPWGSRGAAPSSAEADDEPTEDA